MVRTGTSFKRIQEFRYNTPFLIDNVGCWTCYICVARINDIVGSDCNLVCVYEQGIRNFKRLLCRVNNRQRIGTDGNQCSAFGLDVFIASLQLAELRTTVASRACTVEDNDQFLSLILREAMCVSLAIWQRKIGRECPNI